MTGSSEDTRFMPSLLDRLVDDEPDVVLGSTSGMKFSEHQLRISVARDLENLLNTGLERWPDVPEPFTQLSRSLVVYGLPDLSAISPSNEEDQKLLCRIVKDTIETFDCRLDDVRVTLAPLNGWDRTLRFSIEATVRGKPSPLRVSLSAQGHLNTLQYHVTTQSPREQSPWPTR